MATLKLVRTLLLHMTESFLSARELKGLVINARLECFTGNVSFVQATQTYFNTDGTVLTKADLTGLSHTSYSATLYYDDSVLEVRGTASFRSKYIPAGGVNPGNLNDFLINPSTLNIDASASYRINQNFQVTFDGINLTNQSSTQLADSVGQRLYYNHYTGTNYFLGVRYTY